jgi:hypothetical protein
MDSARLLLGWISSSFPLEFLILAGRLTAFDIRINSDLAVGLTVGFLGAADVIIRVSFFDSTW